MTCPGYHALARVLDRMSGGDAARLGDAMYALVERLYPIPRSITGDGVRETLRIVGETLAEGGAGSSLTIHEVPTGTPVLDWTVPKEWNVREAWIRDPAGRKVVDFADHTLHLLGYSVPVHERLPLAELKQHLHSLPDQPDLIPYRTSYYAEAWGFCLPHRILEGLPEGEYEVKIDADLSEGSLTYGELAVPGDTDDEVLISCHVCHPSLANDNLSGLAVTAFLARELLAVAREEAGSPLRYTYRFVWAPGTIGAITWLARNPDIGGRIAHGLVAANLGDSGPFHYKRSQREDAPIDRAVAHLLGTLGEEHAALPWVPFGYDERQYGSPGFDLPVGLLSRTPWGRFPEYHTSADDLSLVSGTNLAESLETYLRVMAILEGDLAYRNLSPHGEPQLGRRGLYARTGGSAHGTARERQLDLLWVLNQSNGRRSLLDVAERAGRPFAAIRAAADRLCEVDLLAPASDAYQPVAPADPGAETP